MIKQTVTQVRPNINVHWGLASTVGIAKIDLKLKYPDYYLEEPTVVISDDGLTRVQTFTFKDGFTWGFNDEEKAEMDKIEKYKQENGITTTWSVEEI